jgi:hypothetical protein
MCNGCGWEWMMGEEKGGGERLIGVEGAMVDEEVFWMMGGGEI